MDRLKQRKDFLNAARGRRWAAPGLVVQMARRTDGETAPRVGFTASRKVGNAVRRNRAKRRLRAIVHDVLLKIAREGFDYVLIARNTTPARSYQALIEDMTMAVTKLHANRTKRD